MEKISLYDYLGHAAGGDLGQQVAYAAAKAGVVTETRQVSNQGTSGKQLLKG